MPIMDGETVIKHIPEVSPRTKVIIMTGYTDENYIKDHILSQKVDAFLEKPIDLDTLKATVDKLCVQ
jgi:two-component system response regulator (stage 0 sporulation protein F)